MSNSKRKSRKMRLSAMALTALFLAASANAAPATPYAKMSAKEAQMRELQYREQDDKLTQARDNVRAGKYKEAVDLYDKMIKELSAMLEVCDARITRERLQAVSKECRSVQKMWSQQILREARFALSERRFDDAISSASKIHTILGEVSPEAVEVIDTATRMKAAAERADALTIQKIDKNYDENQKKIKKYLAEAESFYRAGRYDEARNRVEAVYLINPYDQRAIVMMDKIFRDYLTFGEKRKDTAIAGGYAFSEWTWAEPVFGANRDEKLVVSEKVDNGELMMQKRLEEIIIDEINFMFNEKQEMKSVIELNIENKSKECDPQKKGIVIEIQGELPKVKPELHEKTFAMKNIPMSEYLRYFSLVTGVPYRVTSDRVIFGSGVNQIQRKQFQVRLHLITTIKDIVSSGGGAPVAVDDAGEGEEGADPEAEAAPKASARNDGKISDEELKKYFSDRGIPFGPGCSITYDERRGRLTVNNTVEYLRQIDELLRQLDAIQTPLVMIEIKCVQIAENDIQELGFDWSLNGSSVGSNYSVIAGSTAMGSDGKQVTDGSTAVGALVQGAARELATRGNEAITGISNTAVLNQLNIFPALFGTTHPFGGDVAFNLFLTINALSQNTRTESMATPKVITSNDKEANIKMVKKMYFPEDWDTYEIETNQGGEPYIKPPVPDFPDDPEEIGVIFRVRPTIDPDGRTIQLHLIPRITQYVSDDEYYMSVRGYWRYSDGKTEDTVQTFKVTQPVITERSLDVTVKVYDGETLVLGGMVQNESITRNDKIPILGDLPYIGRFFQTQAENSKRTNLILFVTTRLINNDGVPILRNQQNGLPDFNR